MAEKIKEMEILSKYYFSKLIISAFFILAIPVDNLQASTLISGLLSERVIETLSSSGDGIYQLTADGTIVVYSGIPNDSEGFPVQLYSVKIDGSEPRQLTDFNTEGRIFNFRLTEDSKRVVFMASTGLFSVSLSDGKPIRLDNPPTQRADSFQISRDSAQVVFYNLGGVFSVPTNGGSIQLLSDTGYPSQGDPFDYKISPDSEYVVFSRLEFIEGGGASLHILSTPISGGALNELLPTDQGPQDSFANKISPTGDQVFYLSARNELQLFGVPIEGGTRVALSPVYSFDFNLGFRISPDGHFLIYTVQSFDEAVRDNSFLVSAAGGNRSQIDLNLFEARKSCGASFTPNSSKVVFCKIANQSGGEKVFTANIESPLSRIALNNGQEVKGFLSKHRFSNDGQNLLLYSVSPKGENFDHNLASLPVDGGMAEEVFNFQHSSSTVCPNSIDFSSDNSAFSYCRTEGDFDSVTLVAQTNESSNEIELDASNALEGERIGFHAISQDGKNVVYLKHFENEGIFRLFSTSTASPPIDDLCFPIKSVNSVAVVCL